MTPDVKRTMWFDYDTGLMIQKSEQNTDAIIADNLRQQTHGEDSFMVDGEKFTKVASIPLILIEKIKNELGIDFFKIEDQPAFMALLNNGDWSKLRTSTKTL